MFEPERSSQQQLPVVFKEILPHSFADKRLRQAQRAQDGRGRSFPPPLPSAAVRRPRPRPSNVARVPRAEIAAMYKHWRELIVPGYTKAMLTQPNDKRPAPSGLALRFADMTGDKYVDGLWRNDMMKQLVWLVDQPKAKPVPLPRRAPSFSWASVDGDISFRALYPPFTCTATVVDVSCAPADRANPCGHVADGGFLILEGPVVPAWLRLPVWEPGEAALSFKSEPDMTESVLFRPDSELTVSPVQHPSGSGTVSRATGGPSESVAPEGWYRCWCLKITDSLSKSSRLRTRRSTTSTGSLGSNHHQQCSVFTTTYDHTHWNIRDPVRSPLVKLARAGFMLSSVTPVTTNAPFKLFNRSWSRRHGVTNRPFVPKWWEASRPNSMAAVSWDQKRSWVDWAPKTRGETHTFLAEGTGHGNFQSYHRRFHHQWDPRQDCLCGLPREVGHAQACEIRKLPFNWSRRPPPAPSRAEAKWMQRGKNAVVHARLETALKKLRAEKVLFASREGVEITGLARPESPGGEEEEELLVVEPGRLER
ncbi:hypothetical protein MAPG_10707 [Magnaporthiopsis poae ATCC 64411]|uniref:Uncharacterized protein n=1 Tax=Magnaporthiopsis poae (strain ATCC 64411 / 73-15) TaxID=644358 RepID=A0A0C4EDB2_MAGP6|nr:hypothetical protein MAPG_10707 [Magnaporthiopsis poae ATCC 64411]